MALLRTSELMNQTSYFLARWDNKLSEGSKNNLLSVREQLHLIHGVLTRNAIGGLSPKAKAQLSQACQQVNAIFSEEHGRAVKASEGEVR